MSSPEIPTPVATTKRATGGTPYSPVYEAEACLPPETLLDSPWVQSSDGSIQKRYSVGTWTLSSNAGGNPRSGPNPKASTEPRRAPQTLPQLGRTLQGDGNMRPEGDHLAITKGVPLPNPWSISVSSVHRSKPEGLSFSSFCN
jgi:hypothetical protein